ncbi:hypothetical protein LCGC14_1251420 [marine sediment metagenome]|uniref:Uncharacterized protein n=1 Tax=marine sediment metagenome TaxID=412755 RepID=A0A0F9LPL8_9ZZZZ
MKRIILPIILVVSIAVLGYFVAPVTALEVYETGYGYGYGYSYANYK